MDSRVSELFGGCCRPVGSGNGGALRGRAGSGSGGGGSSSSKGRKKNGRHRGGKANNPPYLPPEVSEATRRVVGLGGGLPWARWRRVFVLVGCLCGFWKVLRSSNLFQTPVFRCPDLVEDASPLRQLVARLQVLQGRVNSLLLSTYVARSCLGKFFLKKKTTTTSYKGWRSRSNRALFEII